MLDMAQSYPLILIIFILRSLTSNCACRQREVTSRPHYVSAESSTKDFFPLNYPGKSFSILSIHFLALSWPYLFALRRQLTELWFSFTVIYTYFFNLEAYLLLEWVFLKE